MCALWLGQTWCWVAARLLAWLTACLSWAEAMEACRVPEVVQDQAWTLGQTALLEQLA